MRGTHLLQQSLDCRHLRRPKIRQHVQGDKRSESSQCGGIDEARKRRPIIIAHVRPLLGEETTPGPRRFSAVNFQLRSPFPALEAHDLVAKHLHCREIRAWRRNQVGAIRRVQAVFDVLFRYAICSTVCDDSLRVLPTDRTVMHLVKRMKLDIPQPGLRYKLDSQWLTFSKVLGAQNLVAGMHRGTYRFDSRQTRGTAFPNCRSRSCNG
jgi:hypothetical protein